METLRLDVWLDVACLFRTRSEAQNACKLGRVDVNGQAAKPHREIRPGDEIVISRPLGRKQTVVVEGSPIGTSPRPRRVSSTTTGRPSRPRRRSKCAGWRVWRGRSRLVRWPARQARAAADPEDQRGLIDQLLKGLVGHADVPLEGATSSREQRHVRRRSGRGLREAGSSRRRAPVARFSRVRLVAAVHRTLLEVRRHSPARPGPAP